MLNDPNIIYGGDVEEDITHGCKSLGEFIVKNLTLGGEKIVYVNGSSGHELSYSELKSQSILVARCLQAYGIRSGDVVSIISENRHEYPVVSFATIYIGATIAPISTFYNERELDHALCLSKPKLVFTSGDSLNILNKSAKKTEFIKNIVLLDGPSVDDFVIPVDKFIKDFSKNPSEEGLWKPVDIQDHVAFIMCSSGTTGLFKGVQITHSNLMACTGYYNRSFSLLEMILDEDLVLINVAPWFHSMGFVVLFIVSCMKNVKLIYLPQFDPRKYLHCIEKYKISVAHCVPTLMVFLAKSPMIDEYNLESLKLITCGASVLSKELEEAVNDRFKGKVQITQAYGMSELTLGVVSQSAVLKVGSVGSVLPGIYGKVINENGASLGVNQQGELCFKGFLLMKGYIGNEKATKDTIDKDGWLHTGDIGYYDEDQQFFIVDRIKDLIKYKGFQVAPAEIEAILLSHPDIMDSAIVGIPDPKCGELPFAFVVKRSGSDLTENEVIDFVAQLASKQKHLYGGVKFVLEIPKNANRKVLRRQLRQVAIVARTMSKL